MNPISIQPCRLILDFMKLLNIILTILEIPIIHFDNQIYNILIFDLIHVINFEDIKLIYYIKYIFEKYDYLVSKDFLTQTKKKGLLFNY